MHARGVVCLTPATPLPPPCQSPCRCSTAPVNRAPTASPRAYPATEDIALAVATSTGLLVGASDPDGDTLTVTGVTSPTAKGAVVTFTASGSFVYTPVLNFNGIDTFTFTIGDGQGGSATAQATITVGEK